MSTNNEKIVQEILNDWELEEDDESVQPRIILPSKLQPGDKAILKFRESDNPIECRVVGVVFNIGKVRYDLTLFVSDGRPEIPRAATHLLGIDSAFVEPL